MSQCDSCKSDWQQFLDIVYVLLPKNLDCKIILGSKPWQFVALPITTTDHKYKCEHKSECKQEYLFTCKQKDNNI